MVPTCKIVTPYSPISLDVYLSAAQNYVDVKRATPHNALHFVDTL